jgi:hypothetical protein
VKPEDGLRDIKYKLCEQTSLTRKC